MSLLSFKRVSDARITVVGNLTREQESLILDCGADIYIDERDIDYSGRMPKFDWEEKYRSQGWYRQMFIRLCIDRFMSAEQVLILDSEVFPFTTWDNARLYEPDGSPRCFYWIPSIRKPDWDYKMYRGAAYLWSFLPECEGVLGYANSDNYRRHISGVVLFSTKNVAYMWEKLESGTDLRKNINDLFNHHPDLSFSDHEIYGLAVDYGVFDSCVKTMLYNDLLGWYDNHDDPAFHKFKNDAMWSMCQRYQSIGSPKEYYRYMQEIAMKLGGNLPINEADLKGASLGLHFQNTNRLENQFTGKMAFSKRGKLLNLFRKASRLIKA
jgi:hypothetical protein